MGELQKKEEEMRQMFVQRVKEKEAELKEAEKEVLVPMLPSLCREFLDRSIRDVILSSYSQATWEIWPSEEASSGREKEAGGEEEVARRRAQHVQTEKDCRRALAKPSTAGRGLHHAQEGQGEEKVSIFLFLLCLPAICFKSRLSRSLVESGWENCWFSDSGTVWARQRFTFRTVFKLFQRSRIHGNYSKSIKFAPGRFRIWIFFVWYSIQSSSVTFPKILLTISW